MRICLVTDTLPGFHKAWSGANQLCWRLSQMLRKEGHSVTFITAKSWGKIPSQEVYQVSTCLNKISAALVNLPLDIPALLYSILAHKKLRPDIVHLHTHTLFLPVAMASIILKIPLVLTVIDYWIVCPNTILKSPNGQICTTFHGIQCAKCISLSKLRRLPFFYKIFFYSRSMAFDYVLRKLDAIIVLSKTSKARLEQYGLPSSKIHVIYHYQLDTQIGEPKAPASSFQRPTILFVGTIHENKGLHILIQAMSYIVREVPDAELMVVGSGYDKYEAKIVDMVENLELKENIQFLGKRKNEDVLQLMTRSDVIVVPEQVPVMDFGPLVLVEARGLAKPIVASKVGAVSEFIQEGVSGFCVTPDQPQQFADKVVWILRHKEEARVMGENARKSAEFLYNNEPIKEIINLYHSVIALKKRKGGIS